VLQALVWEKLSAYDQILIKNPKREGMHIKDIFKLFQSKRWFTHS